MLFSRSPDAATAAAARARLGVLDRAPADPAAPADGETALAGGWVPSAPEPEPPAPPPPARGLGSARLRGARIDPTRRGLAAVAVVAVLAATVAAVGVWLARPRPVAVTAPSRLAAAPTTPSPTPTGQVVVSVGGKVRKPGLVTLPAGARVADAVRAAGGPQPGVGTGLLNLARRLVDGEQILVGVAAPAGPGGGGGTGGGAGPVSLSTATVEQLEALPGVGPVLAQRIVDYRNQHGAFRSVAQLREVSGIGPAKFADLQPLVSP